MTPQPRLLALAILTAPFVLVLAAAVAYGLSLLIGGW